MMKLYVKKQKQGMFPWTKDINMDGISISQEDRDNGSPKNGDMIAVNANNGSDRWLVAKRFFDENYIEG